MINNHVPRLLVRHPDNPILSAADWPYPMNSVFNAAATRPPDGQTLLLARVEDRRGHSHLCTARSENGIDGWRIDNEPTFLPDHSNYPEEVWGIEDPRITYLEELETYAVVYTSFSARGPSVSLALTQDFKTFERRGEVLPPNDKDAVLLPRRFDGKWVLIHRPSNEGNGAQIWMSYSSDLRNWGEGKPILGARRGAWWDANHIGVLTPLIETDRGWLMLYHGVRQTAAGFTYRLGLTLMDKDDPSICVLRGDEWIFGPSEWYERSGDVNNVVFPCGYTINPDGDTLNLYYGAADTSLALATASIQGLLEWLKEHGAPVGT